jgi:hypothetical protein
MKTIKTIITVILGLTILSFLKITLIEQNTDLNIDPNEIDMMGFNLVFFFGLLSLMASLFTISLISTLKHK